MSTLAPYFTPTPPVSGVDRAMIRETIRDHLLRHSRYIQSPNFVRCSDTDLRMLYERYDQHFFDRQLRAHLAAQSATPLALRFTGRLRSSGGVTRRVRRRGESRFSYAIEISHNVLFENFRTPEETAVVTGIECQDRVDALMRVMEHELLHLAEYLAFGETRCAGERFQSAAFSLFGHTAHQHAMLTRRTRTLRSTSLRPGHRVRFTHEGQALVGMINRINTRATVLVESPRGTRYTDGRSYIKFYVPLPALEPVA
jgi:hypothetical protein